MTKLSKKDIQTKYKKFLINLNTLKIKQNLIISNIVKKIERKKINKLRKTLE